MIRPETLSPEQKRLLLKLYRLDVDEKVRFRRRYRFAIMFLWIRPLLAAGLLWDGTPGSTAFSDKPAEIVAWCFIALLLGGHLFLFVAMRMSLKPGSQDSTYTWYMLFRDEIGPGAPPFLYWVQRLSSVAVVVVAILTGRPILAAAWTCAVAAGIAYSRWEDRLVRRRLAELSSAGADSPTTSPAAG